MSDEYQQKAAELGFDLTKQFLTLAFGGIAFVVGISFSAPSAVSTALLWWAIGLFAASCIAGLLFLMRGVNRLSEEKSFDIYAASLRILSVFQILFVIAGVVMLCPILNHRPNASSTNGQSIEIRTPGQTLLTYPIEPDKNVTIEFDGSKFTFSAKKS